MEFVRQTYEALWPHGFRAWNALPCVCVCRDELMRPIVENIQRTWREAFKLSGLGGMIYLGKAGLFRARDHAPNEDGVTRYVYFAIPHIGLGVNGEVGQCYRPGRKEPSHVCGALISFQEELANGNLKLDLDLDDLEQSLLKQRLFRKLKYGQVPGLVELTRLAHEAIREELERMIKLTINPSMRIDYAVLTGINIHGPERLDYIWPGVMYAVVKGKRQDLQLARNEMYAPGESRPLASVGDGTNSRSKEQPKIEKIPAT